MTAPPRRLRRALARAAKWTAIAIVSLVLAFLAVLDTAPLRRLVAVETNRALAPLFRGTVHVDALGKLGLFGLGGADVTVFDAAGRRVLSARAVRVRLATWSVLRSLLSGKGTLTIAVPEVSIDRVEARLDKDPAGQIGLASAFLPKQPPSPATNEKPGRGLRLVFGRIALAHLSAQGNAVGPPLDVHVEDFAGALTVAPDAIDADVSNAAVRAHKLAGVVDVAGTLRAHVHAPSAPGGRPEGSVTWHGTVATTTSTLAASLRAGHVDGVLDAPAVSAKDVRAFWAASPFDTPGRLHAEAHGPLSRVAIAVRAAMGDASVTADGTADAEHAGPAHAVVSAEVPQGSARLEVDVAREGRARILRLGVTARVEEIDRIPKLPAGVHGSVDLAAKGALRLDAMVVDADAEVVVTRFVAGANRLANMSLDARVRGPVGDPDVTAVVHGRSMVLAGRRIDFADIGARGSPRDFSVRVKAEGPDIPRVGLSASVRVRGGVAIHAARLALDRGADRVVLSIPMATLDGGALRVEGARIEGAGGPIGASFEADAGHLRVRAASEGLDLGVIARVGGLQATVASGVLAVDVDADLRRDGATGRAAVRLDRGAFGATRGVSGAMEVTLDDRRIRGHLRAEAADVGSIDVEAPKLVLPGEGPLSALSWRRARGDVTLEARADLAKLVDLVPVERSPFAQAAGHVAVAGHLARIGAGAATPDVELAVTTQGLHLVPKVDAVRDIDGVWVMPEPPWHLDGIDFAVAARVEGATGRVDVGVTARDAKGPFAHVDATCPRFPSADALGDPRRVVSDLRTTAFDVHLTLPRRDLGGLPPMLRQDFVSGAIEADAHASGTMLAPRLDVTATVRDSVAKTVSPMPIEFDLSGHYDAGHGNVSVGVKVQNREVLASAIRADLDAASLLAGTAGAPPWTASARAHFDGLPLEAIAALDDKMVSGHVSGDVAIDGLHRDARADAELSIDALHIGTVAYESARVTLQEHDGHLGGEVRVNQKDGFVDTKVDADAAWGAAMAPMLAADRPLKADVASKNFRIVALLPFVDRTLDELDGRLDSNAHLELDPRARQAHLSGTVSLAKGVVEASAGGGELHDISADLTLAPDGSFTITKLSASGMTGQLHLTGSGQMDGLHLRSAKATITIPKNRAIPVIAGGAELGSIDGRIELSAAGGAGATRLQITVPSIRVTLPGASAADVQSLGVMNDVRIGAHRGNPATFVLLPAHPSPPPPTGSEGFAVAVQIGDAVVVRGTDLRVHLDGQVDVRGANVSGRIVLKRGGVLVVQGKTFTVEDGTVTFAGPDPSNPQVVVHADYKAPDGTMVHAAFVGPLKTGKVTLSSDPSYPRDEIVELLLFGTTGGPQAQSPSPGVANSVVGSVGSEAAQPLNHALDQLGLGAVRANVDTSSSTNPRPEVEIQIARDISLKVAVVLGQVPPGVNPDHTLLTVGWRFLSKWSLASTIGDAGTTIFDLLWQRRY